MANSINATPPSLNLQLRNFTTEMVACGSCLGWYTFEDIAVELDETGRIALVEPRVGGSALTPPAHGSGPRVTDDLAHLTCARFYRKQLDYLFVPVNLPGTTFTLVAAVVVAELFPNGLTLMAVSNARRSVRIAIDAEGPVIRHGSWEERTTLPAPAVGRPFLVALSNSSGCIRAAIWEPGEQPDWMVALEQNISMPVQCDAVLGADCVGENLEAPMPSAPRSWDGGIFDFWVFDRDLLADPVNLSELGVICDYTNAVLGKTEPKTKKKAPAA